MYPTIVEQRFARINSEQQFVQLYWGHRLNQIVFFFRPMDFQQNFCMLCVESFSIIQLV